MDAEDRPDQDPEIAAMLAVYESLKQLAPDAQQRVLKYVMERLGLQSEPPVESREVSRHTRNEPERIEESNVEEMEEDRTPEVTPHAEEGFDEGLSPVALKWMKRNGLSGKKLSPLFSLGVDEIDLVARKVPGASKAQKFRSVVLLKGVASYLGSGNAKVDHKPLKEAAGHYGAEPGNNFTTYIKNMAAEISGTAATGYTLTPRGLSAAKDLIVEMTTDKKAETK